MRTVHFITATNALKDCPTLATLAREMGVAPNTIRQARLSPDAASYRAPPAGWEAAVAKLARKRAAELLRLAEQLERKG